MQTKEISQPGELGDDKLLSQVASYCQAVAHVLLNVPQTLTQDQFAASHESTFRDFVEDTGSNTLFITRNPDGGLAVSPLLPEAAMEEEKEEKEEEEKEEQDQGQETVKRQGAHAQDAQDARDSHYEGFHATLLIIKNNPSLDCDTPISTQLNVVKLPRTVDFDTLKSFVGFGVASMFDAVVSKNTGLGTASDPVNLARRKINDLSLSLQNLQQVVQVPDIGATAHPLVREAISRGANPRNYTQFLSEEQLLDSSFLNSLQRIANGWIRAAQRLTRLTRNVEDGSAFDEVHFWGNLEQSLQALEEQINIPEVQITLSILTAAKRFHATVTFVADTGLSDRIKEVRSYNQLMGDFPISELHAAGDFESLERAIDTIAIALKKLRVSLYPVSRAMAFIEKLSQDVAAKLKSLLPNMVVSDYEMFQAATLAATHAIGKWDALLKEFTAVARELLRKRSEKYLFVKINTPTDSLREVLGSVGSFRKKHYALVGVLQRIGSGPDDYSRDLERVYAPMATVDPLHEPFAKWAHAEKQYDQRVGVLENKLVEHLQSRLERCGTSGSMFYIFEQFRPLMSRPRIRTACREYQHELLGIVKDELAKLQLQFSQQGVNSEVARLRDVPPVAASIMWARQMNKRLNSLMSRLGVVLGADWKHTSEGGRIYAECTTLLERLDTTELFESWVDDVSGKGLFLDEPILKILKHDGAFEMHVNFDASMGSVFKELRNLLWMGFTVPSAVVRSSRRARSLYPHASVTTELLQTFVAIVSSLESRTNTKLLLRIEVADVWALVRRTMTEAWDTVPVGENEGGEQPGSPMFESPLALLEHSIADLVDKYQELQPVERELADAFEGLSQTQLDAASLSESIERVQSVVDGVVSHGFKDTEQFLDSTNARLADTLASRTAAWLQDARFPKQRHVLTLQGQSVRVLPSLEHTKSVWVAHVNGIVHSMATQKRVLDKKRFGVENARGDQSFAFVVPRVQAAINNALAWIERNYKRARDYVEEWRKLEALWRVSEDSLAERIGTDLQYCCDVLVGLQENRKLVDTVENEVELCPCLAVNYEQAQVRVTGKYDYWQKVLCKRLLEIYQEQASALDASLLRERTYLECSTIDTSSLSKVTELISRVDALKNTWEAKDDALETFRCAQRLLQRNRFRIPAGFTYCEQIESDLSSLKEIAAKKEAAISKNRDLISTKLETEVQRVYDVSVSLQRSWAKKKPVSVDTDPCEALAVLNSFEESIGALRNESTLIARAAKVLLIPLAIKDSLESVLQDVLDYKSVWTSVDRLWNALQGVLVARWCDIDVETLRETLQTILQESRGMPQKVFQYKVFQNLVESIQGVSQSTKVLAELKDPALKPRHWAALFKDIAGVELEPETASSCDFTLNEVLSLNPLLNAPAVSKVVQKARGERVLESSVNAIKKQWRTTTFEKFAHSSGMVLVKSWDTLFRTCTDDINTLVSMKNSPHYKIFEQEAIEWESKLAVLHAILTSWVEVQRQWVYLQGVLGANGDIKRLLPAEASKFGNISGELKALLGKVFHSDVVLDVLHVADCSSVLKRLLESLHKVRKSLNEFLESQRKLFPRFYFVGNEDLLQIIGAGDDLQQVSRHLQKMFAGAAGLLYENKTIAGVHSAEGEELLLDNPVRLEPGLRLDEWMTELDTELKLTLSRSVQTCIAEYRSTAPDATSALVARYPFQVSLLALQVCWTAEVEECLSRGGDLGAVATSLDSRLDSLSSALGHQRRHCDKQKTESLLVECVHMRSVLDELSRGPGAGGLPPCTWDRVQKFYYDDTGADPLERITVSQCGYTFLYGFEYIGVPERLIYTPLLENCFVAMAHALSQRCGGSPFGPAGTGKTETVKALGQNLGRMVFVFNCDDSFDFQSMGRLLFGIAQIGAWGCFDEFNRLEENILSAVSTQIESIQTSLLLQTGTIEILGKTAALDSNTGIFVTMNPGYAGRSELPENLKKMFREFSMKKPDSRIIAEVLMSTLGFAQPAALASRTVELFAALAEKATPQKHYDFGLRALKGVLRNCQSILAHATHQIPPDVLLLRSMNEMVLPKLVAEDELLFGQLAGNFFPDTPYEYSEDDFAGRLGQVASTRSLCCSEQFVKKCTQFYQVQRTQQAIILVGEPGAGKTAVWKSAIQALKLDDGVDNIVFVVDTKALTKDDVYGTLDSVTFEWRDGVFTSILRRLSEDTVGNFGKSRVWVVFDSDLDPDYAETLNSVLDDNKLLTLPNGERLRVPANLHIVFEVHSLAHATPATVSRCGMIWLADSVASPHQLLTAALATGLQQFRARPEVSEASIFSFERAVLELLTPDTLASVLALARSAEHVMGFDVTRSVHTLVSTMCAHFAKHHGLADETDPSSWKAFVQKKLQVSLVWAMAGDSGLDVRCEFGDKLCHLLRVKDLGDGSLIDYDVSAQEQTWVPIAASVPPVSLEAHEVLKPDVVVPTLDTTRHESLLFDLLNQEKPLLLCGPPGSGKTMTLYNALRRRENCDVVGLNFSKETTVQLLLKTLEQHTAYSSTSQGLVMQPRSAAKQLVVFCDEINLPKLDAYGSQPVILFIRQLVEKRGFWHSGNNQWVAVERIQVVGACNPPTDAGRTDMTRRFTRHAAVVMVDYPGTVSLAHIYNVFFAAVLKLSPELRGFSKELTAASLEVYHRCKDAFTADTQPHYIYSPRELTRWVRGIYHATAGRSQTSLAYLVKIWAHEALRLFCDRLVDESERRVFHELLKNAVSKHFPNQASGDLEPSSLLFTTWLSLEYKQVERRELTRFVRERMKTFCEEELETDLIIYDDMVDNMLRMDRVLRQVQGHAILVGPGRSGKTTITRFVSWINGLRVVQPSIHRNFTLQDFDDFLRALLQSCATENQKTCLIIDESNILETSFLERMNTLLANSDVPGLFEAEEYDALISRISQRVQQLGLLLDTEQEMYDWFTQEISRNLHVVFTINDPGNAGSAQLITSPALFNRCVMNYAGNWSVQTMSQVADAVVQYMPLDKPGYEPGVQNKVGEEKEKESRDDELSLAREPKTFRDVLVNAFVVFHKLYYATAAHEDQESPSAFLNNLLRFQKLYSEKASELEENQRFICIGLDRLRETVLKVRQLNQTLSEKQGELEAKEQEARRTLDKMLADQNEAERKQEASIEIQRILAVQEREISERRAVVVQDLAQAEPAILEAQRGVKNIKKQQFTEIRSMLNPPSAVKTTMEAVCVVLGYVVAGWKDIQLAIRRDDFVTNIVNYDTAAMLTPKTKQRVEREYLARPDFDYETVLHASKACGPLYQWVVAQVRYAEMLAKVGPLKEEVAGVEQEMLQTRARLLAADDMIGELQAGIEQSKEQYGRIIRDVELIKTEMESVHARVGRSVKLMESLDSEKSRWLRSTQQFGEWRRNLVGDCLLSSTYASYCGPHNQRTRAQLFKKWRWVMGRLGINHDPNYSFIGHTVDPLERMRWISHGLPDEDLHIENFSLLLGGAGYPYVVDPSSRIVQVLEQHFGGGLVVSSFLDQGFVKQLENTLRFGGCIVIQDGEFFDPIVSKVVGKEFRRAGGRQTVQVGAHEVDVSPEFFMVIHTRDPGCQPPPYVKTRTCLVNFTIDRGSVEAQALQITLSKENPRVQKQRNDLLRLNGEYKLRLRELEQSLLRCLNSSEGNILENDELVATLEQLKVDAAEVESKIGETTDVIAAVEGIANEYYSLGEHSTLLFTLLGELSSLHWFYEVSVSQFMDCFASIFETASAPDGRPRASQLLQTLYCEVYARFSPNLVEHDKIVFATVLFALYHRSTESRSFQDVLEQTLLLIRDDRSSVEGILKASGESTLALAESKHEGALADLLRAVADKEGNRLRGLLGLAEFFQRNKAYTLARYVEQEGPVSLIVASARGADGTFKVQQLAAQRAQKLKVVALGSAESVETSDAQLSRCSAEGKWLLLQNLQTSPQWVRHTLPKRLHYLLNHDTTSPNFKVFMTCGLQGKALPAPLLQPSYKLAYEGEPGVWNVVKDLWRAADHSNDRPIEKIHCRFLLAWYHALLVERCRFAPIGFCKKYDFNDSDYSAGLFYLDQVFAGLAQGRDNVDPGQAVPWDTISFNLGAIVYGGKVDSEPDLEHCKALSVRLFDKTAFCSGFEIVPGVAVPENRTAHGAYDKWLEDNCSTPENYPQWLQLPETVDHELSRAKGQRVAEVALDVLGRLVVE